MIMLSQDCSKTIKKNLSIREKNLNNQFCTNSSDLDFVSESSFAPMSLQQCLSFSTVSCLTMTMFYYDDFLNRSHTSELYYLNNRIILQRRHTSKIALDKSQFILVYHKYNSCY